HFGITTTDPAFATQLELPVPLPLPSKDSIKQSNLKRAPTCSATSRPTPPPLAPPAHRHGFLLVVTSSVMPNRRSTETKASCSLPQACGLLARASATATIPATRFFLTGPPSGWA